MHALAGTTYGISAPKGGAAHDHMPDPEALMKVGKAFDNAPVPIKVHFDLGDDYPSGTVAEPYLIRDTPTADLARGGESIVETACDPAENPATCLFPAYPGTVPWKTGFRFLRDESLSHRKIVGGVDKGPDDAACVAAETDRFNATTCVRRFDVNRRDTFRYGLWAHALALPKVDDSGVPLVDGGSYIPQEHLRRCRWRRKRRRRFHDHVGGVWLRRRERKRAGPGSDVDARTGSHTAASSRSCARSQRHSQAGSELQTELPERHELSVPDWRHDRRRRPARGHIRHRLLASGAERPVGDTLRPEAQRKQPERSARLGVERRRGVTVPIEHDGFHPRAPIRPRATP